MTLLGGRLKGCSPGISSSRRLPGQTREERLISALHQLTTAREIPVLCSLDAAGGGRICRRAGGVKACSLACQSLKKSACVKELTAAVQQIPGSFMVKTSEC